MRAANRKEVEDVVDRRNRAEAADRHVSARTVVEPELDMDRRTARPSLLGAKIRALVSRLVTGAPAIRAPMRALQRELEERWPGLER